MARNDVCFCGSGIKQKKCHPDIHNESYFAHIIKLHQQIDGAVESSTQFANLKCHKGCAECCFQNFTISSSEFYFLMYNILTEQGEKAIQEYLERGFEYWQIYERDFPESAELFRANLPSHSVPLDFFVKSEVSAPTFNRFPCVFLDLESQSCNVYRYRPHICREFGVAYTQRIELPQAYCSKTMDGKDYQAYMADISSLEEDMETTYLYKSSKYGIATDRCYPIFYFCKINYGKIDSLKAKIREFKDYSMDYCAEQKIARTISRK